MSRPDLRWAGDLAVATGIMPTAAILEGEEARAQGRPVWCCPLCGGLNNSEATLGHEHSAAGWCQHDKCVQRRDVIRSLGITETPEMLLAYDVAIVERREEIAA